MLKPESEAATLREWRELGTTGTTDGCYGEGTPQRKGRKDLPWLLANWSIDEKAVSTLVSGVITCASALGPWLDALREHAPDTTKVALEKIDIFKLVLQSSCATGDAIRRRKEQAKMVSALLARGFPVAQQHSKAVQALQAEYESELAALKESQAAEARRKEEEASMVHPGQLRQHEADLDGLDSRDLRHVDRFYELWSCCGREPRAPGCTKSK